MKLKKWLLGLITFAAMAVLCAVCTGAETYDYGDFKYSVLDDGTVEIIKYSGEAETVDIPSKIDGKSVTKIGDYCADLGNNIIKVIIPNSVINVEENAFSYCYDLSVIDIEQGNKNYSSSNGVLFDKNKTKLIYYPLGKKDKNYIMPNGVKSISDWAFSNAIFTSITMPDSLTEIGDYAFYRASLISAKIPDGVKTIGNGAFCHCESLTDISIPDSVASIGEDAFKETELYDKYSSENEAIVNYIDVNGWAVGIKDGYISKYTSLLTIQEETKHIADYSFKEFGINTPLTVNLPDSMISIGKGAFLNCYTLISVSIPASVQRIDDYAFGYEDYDNDYKKIDGFKIYCYPSTAGEKYAKDNGFDYELLEIPTLAKVTGVKLGGRAADALRINWTKNTSADGYIVEMYQGNKWVRAAKITNNNTTTFRKAGLMASTVYKFRVKAYKMSGSIAIYSDYSAEIAARTNPSVMTGAKLTGRAADALRINWTKNASADGYIVEMYQGGKWARVAKITSNSTTTFRKAGLKASTVYKFRVRAYKMSGKTALYGNYSATVTARTNPSIVKGVKIAGKAKDALRVNWTKNASAQGYIVEMYKGGKWVRVAKITNSNTTTFRKSGLAKNTTYKFRVCAYYMSGKTALYGNYGSVSGKTAAK